VPRLASGTHADGLIVRLSTLGVGPPVNPILMDERTESITKGRICFPDASVSGCRPVPSEPADHSDHLAASTTRASSDRHVTAVPDYLQ
jgi:hypothetical protein